MASIPSLSLSLALSLAPNLFLNLSSPILASISLSRSFHLPTSARQGSNKSSSNRNNSRKSPLEWARASELSSELPRHPKKLQVLRCSDGAQPGCQYRSRDGNKLSAQDPAQPNRSALDFWMMPLCGLTGQGEGRRVLGRLEVYHTRNLFICGPCMFGFASMEHYGTEHPPCLRELIPGRGKHCSK